MKQMLFTVFDSAAQAFLAPFPAATVDVAIRMFRSLVNQAGSQFNEFPSDYTLFLVGEMDQATGIVQAHTPTPLGVAITFVERSMPEVDALSRLKVKTAEIEQLVDQEEAAEDVS